MRDEYVERRVRVDATRVGHHVGGGTAEALRLPADGRATVDDLAVARHTEEAHDRGREPFDQRTDALHTGDELLRGELVGAWRRALHEIGEPDTVVDERVE